MTDPSLPLRDEVASAVERRLPREETEDSSVVRLLSEATPRVWVTPAITVVLVLSFGGSALFGVSPFEPTAESLLAVGAGFGPTLLDGEWWRLLSATVLHSGVAHLLFNLWALWNGGLFAERLFGNFAFLAIYLFSGVGGSLASVAVDPMTISVGASGAIFGIYGALLGFTLTHRGVVPAEALRSQRNSLVGFLFYNVLYALTSAGIDIGAHAGGLITGAVAGLALSRDLLQPNAHMTRRVLGGLAICAALAISAAGALGRVKETPEVRSIVLTDSVGAHLDAGELEEAIAEATTALELIPGNVRARVGRVLALVGVDRVQEAEADCATLFEDRSATQASPWVYLACAAPPQAVGDFEAALDRLQRGKEIFPESAEILALEADIQDDLGRPTVVRELLEQALRIAPESPGLLNNRAWQRIEDGDFRGAKEDADRALAQMPDDASILDTRCFALVGLGEREAARSDCARALALSPDGFVDLGMIAFLEGRGLDAVRAWIKAGASDPSLARELAPWIARARQL